MDEQEITPKIHGIFRYDGSDKKIECFEESATEVRALVESQFLAKRVHAEHLGFNIGNIDLFSENTQVCLSNFIVVLSIVVLSKRVFLRLIYEMIFIVTNFLQDHNVEC